MSLQPWKVLICLLAVGVPGYAQQSNHTKTFKIGGTPLAQPAKRLGRSHTTSVVDNSQAVAPLAAPAREENTRPSPPALVGVSKRNRDNAIQVAEKRVEFAREKMAELNSYNRWAPAGTQPPMSVRMLPYSMSYAPVRVSDPVQSFVPRSTFAHVLVAAEQELKDSELLLEALNAKRESSAANSTSADEGSNAPNSELHFAAVETALRREQFMAESAELRLTQLSNLSRLTYSGTYRNLYRKLELKRLEHQLAAQSLEAERDAQNVDGSSQ